MGRVGRPQHTIPIFYVRIRYSVLPSLGGVNCQNVHWIITVNTTILSYKTTLSAPAMERSFQAV